jgi:hypothetical protein
MTKKHFDAFARMLLAHIAPEYGDTGELQWKQLERKMAEAEFAARTFADIATADNPRFDRARFMHTCGLE